jgi:hypothetical protein
LSGRISDTGNALAAANTFLQGKISDEANARAAANTYVTGLVTTLRSDVNNARFTFESVGTATTHVITHNLNSQFVDACLWIKRDGVYRNDLAAMAETDSNTLTVTLTSAAQIKVVVEDMTAV